MPLWKQDSLWPAFHPNPRGLRGRKDPPSAQGVVTTVVFLTRGLRSALQATRQEGCRMHAPVPVTYPQALSCICNEKCDGRSEVKERMAGREGGRQRDKREERKCQKSKQVTSVLWQCPLLLSLELPPVSQRKKKDCSSYELQVQLALPHGYWDRPCFRGMFFLLSEVYIIKGLRHRLKGGTRIGFFV